MGKNENKKKETMINTSSKYRMIIVHNTQEILLINKYITNYNFDIIVSTFSISMLYP